MSEDTMTTPAARPSAIPSFGFARGAVVRQEDGGPNMIVVRGLGATTAVILVEADESGHLRLREVPTASLRQVLPAQTPADSGGMAAVGAPEAALASEILAELQRARAKFPGKNVTFAALVEEVGELAKATFEEPRVNVRKEAVQVAVMAMRMVLDGDHTFDDWRAGRGLDALTAQKEPTT